VLVRAVLLPLLTLVAALLLLLTAEPAIAQLHQHNGEEGTVVLRSLESLRGLDGQSWQVMAYREGNEQSALRLRIIGYPGKLRLGEPAPLEFRSDRRLWLLSPTAPSTTRSSHQMGEARLWSLI